MTDKSIINEFTRLYREGNNIDEVVDKLRGIISTRTYERLKRGLARLRR